MSKHMISDDNNMNDINPFVMIDFSLPGSSGTPYPFSPYRKHQEEKEKPNEKSIACDKHTKVGGANYCAELEPNCPMSRLLLPERIIQYEDGRINTDLCEELDKQAKDENKLRANVLTIVLLIVLVFSLMYWLM